MSQQENKKKLKFILSLSLILSLAWLYKNGYFAASHLPARPSESGAVKNNETAKLDSVVDIKKIEKIKSP